DSATLTIIGSTVTNNRLTGGHSGAGGIGGMAEGGGIFSANEDSLPTFLTVTDTNVADNEVAGGVGVVGGHGFGGGIYVDETTACIANSRVTDNAATGGAGTV